MSLVELPALPLPREPPKYKEWEKDWPQFLSAYQLAFNAERYATQQLAAVATKNDNIIAARVAGYLLVELFNCSEILTTRPCEQLSVDLQSESRDGGSVNDVVFKIGKMYRDHFIRLCTFFFFYIRHSVSQFPCSQDDNHDVHHPLTSPFPPFLRYIGKRNQGLY